MDPVVDLREPVEALEQLLASAKQLRLTNQIAIDRGRVYEIVDSLRRELPAATVRLRWYRAKRVEDGDPILGNSLFEIGKTLDAVDGIDDLIHRAARVPLTDLVRVRPDRLAGLIDQLRSELVPAAQELDAYESIYGLDE